MAVLTRILMIMVLCAVDGIQHFRTMTVMSRRRHR